VQVVTDTLDRVREVSRRTIAPAAAEYDQLGTFPETSVKALADAGLLGLTISSDHGGLGLGPTSFVAAVEEIAAACPSTAMIFVMHICGTEVIKQSSHPSRDVILSAIARGEHLTTLAFSEKGSRSHFWAPVSRALERDGRHVISADKSWVTSAGHAQSYVVSTGAVSANGPTDSTLYYVEAAAPGVSVDGPWNGLGLRANASAPVQLRDVVVDPASALTAEGEGFAAMLSVALPWFQLGSAAVACGIGRASLEATSTHLATTTFEHLGETLASLPTIRARLAKARVQLDAARALVSDAARSVESPTEETMLKVLESKACAAETALDVTDACMRLCGGAAFSRHLPVERFFRDARAGSVMAPTTDVLYDFIGKALVGMPLF
jgi:alkylation response protein AidB-like acyl-CoA dehydrogenase